MEQWLTWALAGGVLILLEMIVPGGIVVFLGCSALIVALGVKLQVLNDWSSGLLAWFIMSIVMLVSLRSLFMKYFEGDHTIHNVDEEKDIQGSLVEVREDIFPYRDGRVLFRGVHWQARSESEILTGAQAVVIRSEGNVLIVKQL